MSPRKGYLLAIGELFQHLQYCQECAEHRPGCDEGKNLAEYAVSLSGQASDSKEAA